VALVSPRRRLGARHDVRDVPVDARLVGISRFARRRVAACAARPFFELFVLPTLFFLAFVDTRLDMACSEGWTRPLVAKKRQRRRKSCSKRTSRNVR